MKKEFLIEQIDTLGQRIICLTGALNDSTDHDNVLFWFRMKYGIVSDMIRINNEIDKILLEKLK